MKNKNLSACTTMNQVNGFYTAIIRMENGEVLDMLSADTRDGIKSFLNKYGFTLRHGGRENDKNKSKTNV